MSFANQFLRTDISHIFFSPPSSDKNLSGRGLSSLVLWWSFIIDKADSKLTHNWVRMIISIESVTILLWVYFPSSTFIHQTSPPPHTWERLCLMMASGRHSQWGLSEGIPGDHFWEYVFRIYHQGFWKLPSKKENNPLSYIHIWWSFCSFWHLRKKSKFCFSSRDLVSPK